MHTRCALRFLALDSATLFEKLYQQFVFNTTSEKMSKILLVVIFYFIYFTQAKIVDDFRYVRSTTVHSAQKVQKFVQ